MNLTVSSLIRYLKFKLDGDDKLQHILVNGEISNFHGHQSGHLYFTLKDEKAAISCVMFRSYASYLKFTPKNGDKVIISANTSIFETSGQLQLYVTKITLDGYGDLYAKYEELKNRLTSEGYFTEKHKKELTIKYPSRIAVLVGDKSAAMSDIKITFRRRWPLCNVDYYPVLVQGNDAPANIIETLIEVDKKEYEIIILARGGGSFEDLFCFNDENLVKTIYNLNTFIITGIGHEQDFSLADFAADYRAATPTASVEMVTPNITDIISLTDNLRSRLDYSINEILDTKNDELNNLSSSYVFKNPTKLIDNRILRFEYLLEKLTSYSSRFKLVENNLNELNGRMNSCLLNAVNSYKSRLDLLTDKNEYSIKLIYQNKTLNLKRYETLLNAYSKENVLKRGFIYATQDNKLIKRINDINKSESILLHFADGDIDVVTKENKHG